MTQRPSPIFFDDRTHHISYFIHHPQYIPWSVPTPMATVPTSTVRLRLRLRSIPGPVGPVGRSVENDRSTDVRVGSKEENIQTSCAGRNTSVFDVSDIFLSHPGRCSRFLCHIQSTRCFFFLSLPSRSWLICKEHLDVAREILERRRKDPPQMIGPAQSIEPLGCPKFAATIRSRSGQV